MNLPMYIWDLSQGQTSSIKTSFLVFSFTRWLWEWSRKAGQLEEVILRRRSWCRARWTPRSTPATSSSESSLLPYCPGGNCSVTTKAWEKLTSFMRLKSVLLEQKCQFGPPTPPPVNQRVTREHTWKSKKIGNVWKIFRYTTVWAQPGWLDLKI